MGEQYKANNTFPLLYEVIISSYSRNTSFISYPNAIIDQSSEKSNQTWRNSEGGAMNTTCKTRNHEVRCIHDLNIINEVRIPMFMNMPQ